MSPWSVCSQNVRVHFDIFIRKSRTTRYGWILPANRISSVFPYIILTTYVFCNLPGVVYFPFFPLLYFIIHQYPPRFVFEQDLGHYNFLGTVSGRLGFRTIVLSFIK